MNNRFTNKNWLQIEVFCIKPYIEMQSRLCISGSWQNVI